MITTFKNKPISNSLSVFNYYKKVTGRALDRDISQLTSLSKLQSKEDATAEDIAAVYDKCEIDMTDTLMYVYYSMRCAAEGQSLDITNVIDELDISDLTNGNIDNLIDFLTDGKKKEKNIYNLRKFLNRKK